MPTPPTGRLALTLVASSAPAWIVCFVIRKGRLASTSVAAGTVIGLMTVEPENS